MSVYLKKTFEVMEDSYISILFDITVDNITIGHISLMVDDDSTYLERIDIFDQYQNKGYGTQAIKAITNLYDSVFTAPDNIDAKRLYERIGNITNKFDEIDQGYGVYEL